MKLKFNVIINVILLSNLILSIHHIGYSQYHYHNKILIPQIDGE